MFGHQLGLRLFWHLLFPSFISLLLCSKFGLGICWRTCPLDSFSHASTQCAMQRWSQSWVCYRSSCRLLRLVALPPNRAQLFGLRGDRPGRPKRLVLGKLRVLHEGESWAVLHLCAHAHCCSRRGLSHHVAETCLVPCLKLQWNLCA